MSEAKISDAAVEAARMKFGTMEPNHFGCERMRDAIEAALPHILGDADPVEFDYPEFHAQGMGCGLEDRNITDRYEAMRYGFDEALDQMATILDSIGPLYLHPQPAELAEQQGMEVIEQVNRVLAQYPVMPYEGSSPDSSAAGWRNGWNDCVAYLREHLTHPQQEKTETLLRTEFEDWYTQNAFDYVANPVGSRECALMWKAWRAALAATGKQQVGEVQG